MIYLSADYILNAINQLSPVHPFLGNTFLTCKKEKLLIDQTMPFLMDRKGVGLPTIFRRSQRVLCRVTKREFL